jgi:hypothetical protein
MGKPKTSEELAYAQVAVRNLTTTFQRMLCPLFISPFFFRYTMILCCSYLLETNVTTLYFPSCYAHTIIENSNWNNLVVQDSSVPDAINNWVQDPSFGFTLQDACNHPNCNPTCLKI